MQAAPRMVCFLIALGMATAACGSGSKGNGNGPGDGGGASGGDGGTNSGQTGGANQGDPDGGSGGMPPKPISAALKKAVAELKAACDRIDARNRKCGALGKGDTSCAALTAGWFNSDLGFGPEVPDLSKLAAATLRLELGVSEMKCKADCAEAAPCADVLAEARDGACDGAANFTGELDDCRDDCTNSLRGYACGDGQFIAGKARCDGMPDCTNGNDEMCTSDTYDCGGGEVLTHARPNDEAKWDPTCDGKVQCTTTGKDEATCADKPFKCKKGEYVAADDVCNDKDDCSNGNDEADCSEFDCGDGERIPARGVCDSDINCKNNTDDLGCDGWFVCADGKASVAGDQVCEIADLSATELAAAVPDKLYDCADKSDEADCARVICE